MISAATAASRFVRRTVLNEDEYRVNFKQIDCEILDTLASDEACAVTPSISKIYLRLLRAPLAYWEREGVLHFVGEERAGQVLTAWEQLHQLTGVANSTLAKALTWLHKVGIIGYEARKNGVGIRIFLNRARSSIRCKEPQKNLPLAPAPFATAPIPSVGIPFKEDHGRQNLEQDIPPRVSAGAAEVPVGKGLALAENVKSCAAALPPATAYTLHQPGTPFNFQQVVGLVKRELEQALACACHEAIASACRKEAALNREWFERAGLPKAIRVAQHEAFNVLRSHGVLAKKTSTPGPVGSQCTPAGRGQVGGANRLATSLAEVGASLRQVVTSDAVVAHAALRDTCRKAVGELSRLHAQVVANDRPDSEKIETKLEEIERQLTAALWQSMSPADREARLRAARDELGKYEMRMEPEVFAQSVRQRVTASLRAQYGIPRVSLFSL